jgi:short-subunit dehydrogenase
LATVDNNNSSHLKTRTVRYNEHMNNPLIEPKSILITGASSGIGWALALEYSCSGVHLALCARNPDRLHKIAMLCQAKGANVLYQVIDVQNQIEMADWITQIDRHKPLDLVIANAGISGGTDINVSEEEQVRDIFSVNLLGTLNTILPIIEPMRLRKKGQIAVLSSLAGFRGMPSAPAYCSSKAAIRSYGEGLRGRLSGDGISVNVICPGFVRSRITDANNFKMPFMMSASKASRLIRKGLKNNCPRIAFPWQSYFLVRIISALPFSWTDILLRRTPKKI